MVQSLNSSVELTTQGISFLGIGARYGKFLIGDKAFEFFNDNNVSDYIQIPWANVNIVYVNVSNKKIGRRFRVVTDRGNFDFSAKASGKILKTMREHIGDDKILRNPTIWQRVKAIFSKKRKMGS